MVTSQMVVSNKMWTIFYYYIVFCSFLAVDEDFEMLNGIIVFDYGKESMGRLAKEGFSG